jgi:hypothetical protein
MTPCPELSAKFDWRGLFWVDPATIRLGLAFRLWPTFRELTWSVVDGDWDRCVKAVEADKRHRGIRQFLLDGLPFERTVLYRRALKVLERREVNRGCTTPEQFARERSRLIRQLDGEVRRDGRLRSHADYLADAGLREPVSEISVALSREGHPLLCSGWHRVTVAQLAGLGRIPVRIVLRHREWAEFYEGVADTFENRFWHKRYKTYSPIDHIDFQHWESVWSHYRWERIREYLPSSGRALDIGAMCGYFASRMAQAGLIVDAVEVSPRQAAIMERLRAAAGLDYRILVASFYDLPLNGEYDVALALNIFHHALKTRETHEQLRAFLGRLRARQVFFQAHRHRESQMREAYRDYDQEEFARFLVEHIPTVDRYETIGHEHGRRLFRLYAA